MVIYTACSSSLVAWDCATREVGRLVVEARRVCCAGVPKRWHRAWPGTAVLEFVYGLLGRLKEKYEPKHQHVV